MALIEALGSDDAVIFGHDWGAVAAYGAAIAAPERVRKLVTAAVPYGPQIMTAFMTSYAQQKRSWYMFFFQTPFAETRGRARRLRVPRAALGGMVTRLAMSARRRWRR